MTVEERSWHCNFAYRRSWNFHFKNNSRKKISCCSIFVVSFNLRNFFNGWRLQYGRVHGEFLPFSLLQDIRRARDPWL